MQCSIVGLGTALPPGAVAQEDALAMSSDVICDGPRQERLLRTLFRKSGVRTRRTAIPWRTGYEWAKSTNEANDESGATVVACDVSHGPPTGHRMSLYAKHAPPLAERSAAAALKNSPVAAGDITHLVTVSCTGFSAPGVDIHLINQLGLPPTTQRVHVGFMGCHGAINGMRTARGLAAANPDANVLLCAVELCSLHFRMTWDDESMAGNALFADGSAALVVNNSSPDEDTLSIVDTRSCLLPDSGDKMSWMVGDHGFEMKLSGAVPDAINDHVRPWLIQWLAEHNLTIDAIGDWIVHPGGPRILDAVVDALKLPEESVELSREVLSELGNMSSPTVLFVLERSLAQKRSGPRVVLGFGPGLVAEAALLR